ncbi:ABC transporter ATP-binding protein [Microlunatus soli]|uniref:ABC-2 type transport system ATP-binding protein n=1 Tax=Microlunatus soli TaxID=630515 RepID=A0A1H1U3A1_9ACTN|nr:ABC transporter ATP-binding protein [Microlunatus soli]SDS66907.1 ABC-2 type transport system ATP-binding protein [Microlunatus soli]
METTLTETAVLTQGLQKSRGTFALREVDLRIPTGFVTGLVGPNGAGKTTLIKCLLGLVEPDAGCVNLFGTEPAANVGIQERVGVVLDRITAAPEWRAGSIGRRIGGLYTHWDEPLFTELLHRFEVPTGNRVDALSRGQTVKLSFAMALAHHPELLILDEPSSGLDPGARRELTDTIREFMIDPSHTVLFSTHITSDLDDLADHVVVLNAGTVAYTGMLDELHEQFAVVRGQAPFPEAARPSTIGLRIETSGRYEGLIRVEDTSWFGPETVIDAASTDDIVVHFGEQARADAAAGRPAPDHRQHGKEIRS